jgi:DNA-binding transcriptional ArsR family regulator
MITWEAAERCLLFAQGRRNMGVTLYKGVRNADFPESLLKHDQNRGSHTEEIAALFDEGKGAVEIAKIVGLRQGTVSEHIKKIKDKRKLYQDWKDFMEYLALSGQGDTPLSNIITNKGDLKRAAKNKIFTLYEFLQSSVHYDVRTYERVAINASRYYVCYAEIMKYLKPRIENYKPGDFPGQINLFDLMDT